MRSINIRLYFSCFSLALAIPGLDRTDIALAQRLLAHKEKLRSFWENRIIPILKEGDCKLVLFRGATPEGKEGEKEVVVAFDATLYIENGSREAALALAKEKLELIKKQLRAESFAVS